MLRILPMALALLLAACTSDSGEQPGTTIAASTPAEVATDWIDAVARGDLAQLEALVEPVGLAVMAAVENNLRSDELVGLLRGGVTGDLAAGYWAEFRDDFASIQGESLAEVTVGDVTPVPGSSDYSNVTIATATTEGSILLRRTDAGWQIDFAATLGPALIGPLGEYLASARDGANGPEIAAAYAEAVVPGLEAAFAVDPANTNLDFETEYIRQLVSG